MRLQREFFKPKKEGVYLHVYNHTVTLDNDPYPLGAAEKQKFIQIAERYLIKYNIELISLVVMGNHYHALLYCGHEKLNTEQSCKAFNSFHKRKKPVDEEHHKVKILAQHSNNFSEYMREVQREFSLWYNNSRPYKRKGALWQDRFQCQLIQSDVYLWSCLKYIEMNPVRANICETPEDYTYSSFGRWKEQHPYQDNLIKHILSLSGNKTSLEDFKLYMKEQMKLLHTQDLIQDLKSEGRIEEAKSLIESINQETQNSDILIFTFAKEDWISKKVIGSSEFERQKYREWLMYRSTA